MEEKVGRTFKSIFSIVLHSKKWNVSLTVINGFIANHSYNPPPPVSESNDVFVSCQVPINLLTCISTWLSLLLIWVYIIQERGRQSV